MAKLGISDGAIAMSIYVWSRPWDFQLCQPSHTQLLPTQVAFHISASSSQEMNINWSNAVNSIYHNMLAPNQRNIRLSDCYYMVLDIFEGLDWGFIREKWYCSEKPAKRNGCIASYSRFKWQFKGRFVKWRTLAFGYCSTKFKMH